MINNNRTIENAYSMLQFTYDELRTKRFKSIDISIANTLDELYAIVIALWAESLAKEGLYKEYVERENEELTSPIGQINIQESIIQNTKFRGSLICSYDEFSANIYINHIVKGTLQYILYNSNVNNDIRSKLKLALQLYNGIDSIDIQRISWKTVKFNNNNIRYKHLIDMCKTLVTEHRISKKIGLNDDRRQYLLFKKQIFKYYNSKYGVENHVNIIEVPYTLDSESPFELYITKTQKLVSIRYEDIVVLVMVRLQDEQMEKDPRLARERLNEFVRYMRDYKKDNKINIKGALLYVNLNKNKLNLQQLNVNNVNDYLIGEAVVDIHDQWKFVANKLDDVYLHFIQKAKNQRSINNKLIK